MSSCNDGDATNGSTVLQGCRKPGGALCLPCAQVKNLEVVVEDTRAFLARLLAQIHDLKERINHEHDPFIHRLPPEIASRIFLILLPRPPSIDVFAGTPHSLDLEYRRPVPLILGAVCRRWRQIAWTTPGLWSILSLRISPSMRDLSSRSALIKAWLDRSGDLPLYFRLTYFHPSPSASFPTLTLNGLISIINAVTHFVHRCRVMSICLPPVLLDRLDSFQVCPLLEALYLSPYNDHPTPTERFPHGFSLAASSPRLKRLGVHRVFLSRIDVHWNNLTHFQGSYLLLAEFLELLRLAHQMTDCTLNYIYAQDDLLVSGSTHTVHRSLKAFRIVSFPTYLWDYLTLPTLSTLSASGFGAMFSGIGAFLERSVSSLSSLQIADGGGDEDDLLELLRHTPMLEYLTVINFNIANQFLETLGQMTLLPRLRYLQVHGTQGFYWPTLPLLFPALPSDKENCRPLSTVLIKLYTGDWGDGEDHEETTIDLDSLACIQVAINHDLRLEIKDLRGRNIIHRSQLFHQTSASHERDGDQQI